VHLCRIVPVSSSEIVSNGMVIVPVIQINYVATDNRIYISSKVYITVGGNQRVTPLHYAARGLGLNPQPHTILDTLDTFLTTGVFRVRYVVGH
jgi:hypothetical protein